MDTVEGNGRQCQQILWERTSVHTSCTGEGREEKLWTEGHVVGAGLGRGEGEGKYPIEKKKDLR